MRWSLAHGGPRMLELKEETTERSEGKRNREKWRNRLNTESLQLSSSGHWRIAGGGGGGGGRRRKIRKERR